MSVSNLAIFTNFKSVDFLTTRFSRRQVTEIWDANLHSGAVTPFACPVEICDDETDNQYFYSTTDCICNTTSDEIIPAFCESEAFTLVDGVIYQTNECGEPYCKAGVPIPNAPIAGEDCSGCGSASTSYVVTFTSRNMSGQLIEGSPSEPSNQVTYNPSSPNNTVTLPEVPTGWCIVAINIYRVESQFEDGSGEAPIIGSEYLLVGTVGINTVNFTDNTVNPTIPLLTNDPLVFPAPENLVSITRTEDGIVVADTNRLYISMSGQPQFSYEGVVNIDDTIVHIESIGNVIFVFTDNFPVRVNYQHSQGGISVDRTTVYRKLPLKSKKGISVYGGRVFFPSEYSMYWWDISGYGADIRSAINPLLTPEQWKMVGPDTVVGTAYEYGYMLSSSELGHSIMFEFSGDGVDTRVLDSVMPISYINADLMGLTQEGHIIYREDGKVYLWDWREQIFCDKELHDSEQRKKCSECCPYKIKVYFDCEGKNRFKVARIEFDERSGFELGVGFRQEHFGKEELISQHSVKNSRGFGLPNFSSSQTVSLTVEGCATMSEIRLATAYADLVSRDRANYG